TVRLERATSASGARRAAPAFSSPAPKMFCADYGEALADHALRLAGNRAGPFRDARLPRQRGPAAFEPGACHAGGAHRQTDCSVHASDGPGRCGTSGLRAPARCTTSAAAEARSLKLELVRRVSRSGPHAGSSIQRFAVDDPATKMSGL